MGSSGIEHPSQQLGVTIVQRLHADCDLSATDDTCYLTFLVCCLVKLVYQQYLTGCEILNFQHNWCYILCHILFPFYSLIVNT